MKKYRVVAIAILICTVLVEATCNGKNETVEVPATASYRDTALPVEERVEDLLSLMTLKEKVAQMAQAVIYRASPQDTKTWALGSILSGGGDHPRSGISAKDWLDHCNEYQKAAISTRLGIPLLYGIDSVHGCAKMGGATVFPHNIGLGAANDPELVERIGRITATETAAGGIHWNFSPCIAVSRDERWGRAYESYSESPGIVARLGSAYVRGHEAGRLSDRETIASCPKHYFADGGAEWGTSPHGIDRGNSSLPEDELRRIHLAPYIAAMKENPATVMISFSSIHNEKMHSNKQWIDVLRSELGFTGLIVSDWAGHTEIDGPDKFAQAINAGIDMIMIPEDYQLFITEVVGNVEDGTISITRIDEAVRRILTLKFEMGLFENPFADDSLIPLVGSDEHMAVARDAVRKSLVLLENKNTVLPLSANSTIALVGTKAKDLGALCGGWTIYWGGYSEYETLHPWLEQNSARAVANNERVNGMDLLTAFTERRGSTSILYSEDGSDITGADCAVVVVGEKPYTEMTGDTDSLALSKLDIDRVRTAKGQGLPVVVVVISGRPLILDSILPYCDAVVAAWLPGSMAGPGIADVLFGDYNFTGKLSVTWPESMDQLPINVGDGKEGLYPFGYGLSY